MRGLLELPQILRQAGHGRRRIEYDLRAGESELARAFRKVAIVADVHADVRILRLEDGIAEVARAEVELFPEAGRAVRNVVFPILPEIRPVGIDDRGGVVVDAGGFLLVQRDDDHHLVLLRHFLHEAGSRPIRNLLDGIVPARALLGAEVRTGEDLLHAEDLNALAPCLLDELQVLVDVGFTNGLDRLISATGVRRLDEPAFDEAGHVINGAPGSRGAQRRGARGPLEKTRYNTK